MPARSDRASIAHARSHPRPLSRTPDECWHVYYGDVRLGTIAIRTGMPPGEDPRGWHCGFYPGSHPAECTDGSAATFDQARADFEKWCDQRDWTAEKYRPFDRHERMPHDWKPPRRVAGG